MKRALITLLGITTIINTACNKNDSETQTPTVITASGDITAQVENFRNLLGSLNTGPAASNGRREINWDGVPDNMLGKPLPDDFFNPTGPEAVASRQRGLSYVPGSGNFVVSKSNFTDINANLATSFSAFSGTNTFANTNSKLWPVAFQVPGQAVAASTTAFGAVFTDVDLPNSTFIEFFNGSSSIGKFFVPPHDETGSFSFIGVQFNNDQKITRVQVGHSGLIAAGEADITDGGPNDLVALDDFFYAEPQPQL